MFSSHPVLPFAATTQKFDLKRLLGHVNAQYLQYLQKAFKPIISEAPTSLYGESDEEHNSPEFKVIFQNGFLMQHLLDFFSERGVKIIKEDYVDTGRFAFTIPRNALHAANLTNKDEGDCLFTLNKALKMREQHESEENQNTHGTGLSL